MSYRPSNLFEIAESACAESDDEESDDEDSSFRDDMAMTVVRIW
jgi:hypothetical protein